MIRLKAKQQEKQAEEAKAAAEAEAAAADGTATTTVVTEEKPKTVKILGVGRGKRTGATKEKKRTPGEIRIQKGGSGVRGQYIGHHEDTESMLAGCRHR